MSKLVEGVDYIVENINLMRTEVVGLQFHDYAVVARDIEIGDELEMRREAFNQHDNGAIAVYYNGFKIGYVAREDNRALHILMDRDVPLYGFVIEHNKRAGITKGQRRLVMVVYMTYTFLVEDD